MIETERLLLRQWQSSDVEAYAANMADPKVADWLGGPQTRAAALKTVQRLTQTIAENGYGRFAIERLKDGQMIGAAGIADLSKPHPLFPGVEVGWHLTRTAWGHGYASEAARAVLADGFQRFGFHEVLAFTAETNARSRAVMERLGMGRDESRDFDHPALTPDHPLRRHVVYVARRPIEEQPLPRRKRS